MDIFFARGRIISYLRSSDGSQRALMLECYETLDDFRISDGRHSSVRNFVLGKESVNDLKQII